MKLTFGTGGLRAVMGEEDGQMNLQAIREATRGVAMYVKQHCGEGVPKAAIAYDSRHNSEAFAREAARVLALEGLDVFIYPKLSPTPTLSFAVRHLGCNVGICITASHNPAEYNGYKVYGADGGQVTDETAKAISKCIELAEKQVVLPTSPRAASTRKDPLPGEDFYSLLEEGKIHWIGDDVLKAFLKEVLKCRTRKAVSNGLKVVYTPLHGSGLSCVTSVLKFIGVEDLKIVAEQSKPDGDFPGCPSPNPEDPSAMQLGISYCESHGADILLATDPDCDRVGVAARKGDHFEILTGNQVGVLMLEYLLSRKLSTGRLAERPVVIKTLVTTVLAEKIAEEYSAEIINTLTGFKYIGEQMGILEEKGQLDRYVLGFEESCGYLLKGYARDKDAVGAAMMVCEMADFYKGQGRTLWDRLEEIYQKYGRYETSQQIFKLTPKESAVRMEKIRKGLISNPQMNFQGSLVIRYKDYKEGIQGLPPSDVLELFLADGGKAVLRPSGTEPKLKVYLEKKISG